VKFNIREWKLNVLFCGERHPACKPHLRSHKPDTAARSVATKRKSRGRFYPVMENWYASATTNRVKSWL